MLKERKSKSRGSRECSSALHIFRDLKMKSNRSEEKQSAAYLKMRMREPSDLLSTFVDVGESAEAKSEVGSV